MGVVRSTDPGKAYRMTAGIWVAMGPVLAVRVPIENVATWDMDWANEPGKALKRARARGWLDRKGWS